MLVFLLDGINEKQMRAFMPYVTSLYKKPLISMLGYSSSIHPALWNGCLQTDIYKLTTFYWSPATSPFKKLNWISWIPTDFLRKYVVALLKTPYFWFPKTRPYLPKFIEKNVVPLPPSIPIRFAKYFSNIQTQEKELLFKELEERGISYSRQTDCEGYGDWEYHKLEDLKLSGKDVDFFYIYESDNISHLNGAYSKQQEVFLTKLDTKLKEMCSGHDVFIFSEHGMCEIKRYVNVQSELKKRGLVAGRDFIPFYDSTMVRFYKIKDKEKLISALKGIEGITHLNDSLLDDYGINFPDKTKFGEVIALADPEVKIHPDFFSPVKSTCKAWHGYDIYFEDSKGIVCSNCVNPDKEVRINEIKGLILECIKK